MPVKVNTLKFRETQGGPLVYTVQWQTDSEEEADTGIPNLFKGTLVLKDKAATQWHPGAEKYIVTAQYEGLLNDPPPQLDEFDLDGEFREEKIESFPFRSLLEEQYGAYEKNNRLEFPRLLPKQPKTRTGVKPLDAREEEEENPLFNVRTYPVNYETAVWSFKRKQLPSFVNRLKGSIVESLPPGFEYDGDTKLWFVPKVRRSKRGGSWSIAVHYKGIDEFKHISALQELINVRSGGEGRALTTGNLTLGSLS